MTGTAGILFAQNSYDVLYRQTMSHYSKALNEAGGVFDKSDFEKAFDLLTDAQKMIKDNDKPEKITEALTQAGELFRKSTDVALMKNVNFPDLMKMRKLVLAHPLTDNVMKIWNDAEEEFVSAAEDFDDKDMEGVKKYSENAAKLYKDAELVAVKDHYLSGLNSTIADAEEKDVDAYAPIAIKRAKDLKTEAESVINNNRYDTLKAKELAGRGYYEVNHGLFMMDLFRKMNDEKKNWEDLYIMGEEPLALIAAEFNVPPLFEAGSQKVASQIIQNAGAQRTKLKEAEKENQQLRSDQVELEKSLAELKAELADAKADLVKLTAVMDALKKSNDSLKKEYDNQLMKIAALQTENDNYRSESETLERNKKLIESVTNLFLPSEAEVIRNGNLMIIRLINLNFPTGKTSLEPQYFSLMNKVQKAIQTFPDGTVVIEGHTDGVGDYQKNLELSQGRATSVYQYLLSTMGADAGRISAIGLGSTKPIANNSSEEGRAKNRRIEIVIDPHLENK